LELLDHALPVGDGVGLSTNMQIPEHTIAKERGLVQKLLHKLKRRA
jgi:hypothetical protein